MSADTQKTGRQSKASPKTDYHFRLHNSNYDWLAQLARQKGVSIAKVLNAILFSRPNTEDFYTK